MRTKKTDSVLSAYVKKARTQMKMSQRELGEVFSCTKFYICAMEQARAVPTYAQLCYLRDHSGLPMPNDPAGVFVKKLALDYQNLSDMELKLIRKIPRIKEDKLEEIYKKLEEEARRSPRKNTKQSEPINPLPLKEETVANLPIDRRMDDRRHGTMDAYYFRAERRKSGSDRRGKIEVPEEYLMPFVNPLQTSNAH